MSSDGTIAHVGYLVMGWELLFRPSMAASRVKLGSRISFMRALSFGVACIGICIAYAVPSIANSDDRIVEFMDRFGPIIWSISFGVVLFPALRVAGGGAVNLQSFTHAYCYSFAFDVVDAIVAFGQRQTGLESDGFSDARLTIIGLWTMISLSIFLGSVFSISKARMAATLLLSLAVTIGVAMLIIRRVVGV